MSSCLSVLGLVALVGLIVVVVGIPIAGRGDAAQRVSIASPPTAPAQTTAPSVPLASASFAGTPAVGALFSTNGGRLTRHFCTASVVDSPAGNLIISAAHCVSGPRRDSRHMAFVPGFHDGITPYGVWSVTKVFVDPAWASTADPDHDVAFLTVARKGGAGRLQDVTGANRLGTGRPSGVVRVIGYPLDRERPVRCQNRTSAFGTGQQRFDCKDFTDGTSGGPFVADASSANGNGTVVGVIGGHDEGGLTPDISYSIVFGDATRALYELATGQAS